MTAPGERLQRPGSLGIHVAAVQRQELVKGSQAKRGRMDSPHGATRTGTAASAWYLAINKQSQSVNK